MGIRTPDLLITNQLLYRLSYIGNSCFSIIGKRTSSVKLFMANNYPKVANGFYQSPRTFRVKKHSARTSLEAQALTSTFDFRSLQNRY